MPIFREKPFTSISVKVNQLCKIEDDSHSIELYLGDLLSLISLQSTGPAEAARAIRKNIKYGSKSEVKLALSLLELLVLNGGLKIGKSIASDNKLITVLKGVMQGSVRSGTSTKYYDETVQKMRRIALGWRYELKDLSGLDTLANLYKDIPKKQSSETGSFADAELIFEGKSGDRLTPKRAPPRPKTRSPSLQSSKAFESHSQDMKGKKKGKRALADLKYAIPQINYKIEAPKIRATIADCQTNATALDNSILTLPPESDAQKDEKVQSCFKRCLITRRQILRYLQFVGAGETAQKPKEVQKLDEEFLGSLIAANEQLVGALMRYDKACGILPKILAVEPSSDSEVYYLNEYSSEELELEAPKRSPELPTPAKMEQALAQLDAMTLQEGNPKGNSEFNPFGDP
ncbi:hypothetical protein METBISCDRAFT_15623 [Metschnikowia bicuspidata]|uniref:VHS domain-containing protein n=1 Tax=Metschnikowia bicuspidata TaxID=27322 RepID=A0A4P9ZDB2_9ASCO|nr:hypothetical protein METBISCDRAFT_15623 [Metschnikowia bicuspidata]